MGDALSVPFIVSRFQRSKDIKLEGAIFLALVPILLRITAEPESSYERFNALTSYSPEGINFLRGNNYIAGPKSPKYIFTERLAISLLFLAAKYTKFCINFDSFWIDWSIHTCVKFCKLILLLIMTKCCGCPNKNNIQEKDIHMGVLILAAKYNKCCAEILMQMYYPTEVHRSIRTPWKFVKAKNSFQIRV